MYERNELLPDYYSVRDPTTREWAVLRGSFTILDPNVREGEMVRAMLICSKTTLMGGTLTETQEKWQEIKSAGSVCDVAFLSRNKVKK